MGGRGTFPPRVGPVRVQEPEGLFLRDRTEGQGPGEREASHHTKAADFHDIQDRGAEGWPWAVSCLSSGAFKPARVTSGQERPRQCSWQGAR